MDVWSHLLYFFALLSLNAHSLFLIYYVLTHAFSFYIPVLNSSFRENERVAWERSDILICAYIRLHTRLCFIPSRHSDKCHTPRSSVIPTHPLQPDCPSSENINFAGAGVAEPGTGGLGRNGIGMKLRSVFKTLLSAMGLINGRFKGLYSQCCCCFPRGLPQTVPARGR